MGPVNANFNDAGPGWGWLTFIMPYLEESNLYASLNMKLKCWDPANAAAVKMPVAFFLCPSDDYGEIPIPAPTVNLTDTNNQPLGVIYGRASCVLASAAALCGAVGRLPFSQMGPSTATVRHGSPM